MSDPGRYAAFIQPAYAVTALAFAGMIIDSLWRARLWRRRAEAAKAELDA
jgi:heme exporter protein D